MAAMAETLIVPRAAAQNTAAKARWTRTVIEFVRSIGIPVTVTELTAKSTFLPRVRIQAGELLVDPGVFPGDILHEAGHIATIPEPFRHLADGNLSAVFRAMGEYVEEELVDIGGYKEDPIARGIMQCSDPEATAWQYAAAKHIGLPDKWLFPKESYNGDAMGILLGLKSSRYLGINGLQAAGWTVIRATPYRPLPEYPKLVRWLHAGTAH